MMDCDGVLTSYRAQMECLKLFVLNEMCSSRYDPFKAFITAKHLLFRSDLTTTTILRPERTSRMRSTPVTKLAGS